jgi:hypothetical protein
MKLLAIAAIAALGAALSGCATIIQGTTQSVSVNTVPEGGAQCTLTNSQGTWYVVSPGSVTVHKTKTDLDVTCNKPGYEPGHVLAKSHFGGTTAGNLIAGGVVGIGVDAASGANFYYDSPIEVVLGPRLAGGAAATSYSAPYPVQMRCSSPELVPAFRAEGPEGYLTAKVVFAINSGGEPGTVSVAPGKDGVCTLTATWPKTIANASFTFDHAASSIDGAPRDLERHVDLTEAVSGAANTKTYTFTVKAKDDAKGRIAVDFPVAYK